MSRTRQTALAALSSAPISTILAKGVLATTQSHDLPAGFQRALHAHPFHQLVFASVGVIAVHTQHGSWVVPPNRAVWVSADIPHMTEAVTQTSLRTIYFTRELAAQHSQECWVLNVSPLAREMILQAMQVQTFYSNNDMQARYIQVLLDQMNAAPVVALRLNLPTDSRALHVVQWLRSNPADARDLARLSREAGASARTMERLFQSETGQTFESWRQQLRLLHAVRLLAQGNSVTQVALATGYRSTSAFIAMFKRVLGVTPKHYFTTPTEKTKKA